jgi:hypothetical protein
MKTRPKGIHATFATDCHECGSERTISNGRVDPHNCEQPRPVTLADIRAALDAR